MSQKNVFFIMSSKGGVGKSTFARAFVDLFRNTHQRSLACFDTDTQVAQLAQFYGVRDPEGRMDALANLDPLKGVSLMDLKNKKQRDGVLNVLDAQYDNILFDLPGGFIHEFKDILGNVTDFKREYQSQGYKVWIFFVIDTLLASSKELPAVIKTWGPDVEYVVVKNLKGLDSDEQVFPFYDGELAHVNQVEGKTPHEWIESVQGTVISLPNMDMELYAVIDYCSIPFSQCYSHDQFTRTRRTKLKSFMRDINEGLTHLPHLGMTADGQE